MFEFGKHAPFIWSAYGITAVALALLVAWLIWDGKRQQRALADLDSRGVRRRSEGQEKGDPADQTC